MEILVFTFLLIFYVIYNEIHKLKIKNEKKEFQIPKTFYENLKDTIQYIDYSLEVTKQKQENINKIYLKILEIKKELDEMKNTKEKKTSRKTLKNKEIPKIPSTKESEFFSEKSEDDSFIEKLLQDSDKDKVEFSFQKENVVEQNSIKNLKNNEVTTINSKEKNIFEKIGSFIRKTLQIPEIPMTSSNQEELSDEKQKLQTIKAPITLEDYEKQLRTQNSKDVEIDKNNSQSQNQFIQDMKINPSVIEEDNKENVKKVQIDEEEARKIVILETKKIYSEITNKEKQLQFIKKLIEIGFTNDEIHQITNVPIAEIMLIEKIQKRRGNELNGS